MQIRSRDSGCEVAPLPLPPPPPPPPPGISGDIPAYATSDEVVQYMAAKEDGFSCDYAATEKKAAAINSEPEDFVRTRTASENPYVFQF